MKEAAQRPVRRTKNLSYEYMIKKRNTHLTFSFGVTDNHHDVVSQELIGETIKEINEDSSFSLNEKKSSFIH